MNKISDVVLGGSDVVDKRNMGNLTTLKFAQRGGAARNPKPPATQKSDGQALDGHDESYQGDDDDDDDEQRDDEEIGSNCRWKNVWKVCWWQRCELDSASLKSSNAGVGCAVQKGWLVCIFGARSFPETPGNH